MSPKFGGRGGVAGSQPMSIAVNRSPNKLWRSTVTPYLTYAPKESGMWNVEKGQFCGF
jgi:hypothetical protein